MKQVFLALLFCACLSDRWNLTGGHSRGELDGPKYHDYDTDESALEIGISGPLPWATPAAKASDVERQLAEIRADQIRLAQPKEPEAGGLSTEAILAALGLATAMAGGGYGYKKYREGKTTT